MARLVDPGIALFVARRVTGESAESNSYLFTRLRSDLAGAVDRSEELVAAASGIPAPGKTRWGIIDRPGWVEVNVDSMTRLLKPVADRLGGRLDAAPLPVRLTQRAVLSAELGLLLGYVSRRVLGQYDILVADAASDTGRSRRRGPDPAVLYFVGQNLVEAERRFGFVPEDFALWVALHETTHRFQFEGVPWLRERFFSLVTRYLDTLDLDARSMARRVGAAARRLAAKNVPVEERNPVYLLASEEQRLVLDDIQALMAVVEGHGNFVMDSVGARVIPSFRRMRDTFQRRREHTSVVQRIVNHAIGLEMKLRQYELGQAFCNEVHRAGGPAALARLWDAPSELPTLAELRSPELWLKRVA